MNIKHYLTNPERIITRLKLFAGKRLSDEAFIRLNYYNLYGRYPDLINPVRYTEKAQWFKLNCRNQRYVPYIDKYAVREIIEKIIGSDYLIPLLGKWESADDIDFSTLPSQFVLKCNHDSHSAIVCRDKSKFDFDAAKQKLTSALKRNFYDNSREWLYSQITPCIIAEKYMEDSNQELRDYKFWCFNGRVEFINIYSDRETQLRFATLTRDWKKAEFINNKYLPIEGEIELPENHNDMLALAERLASEFSHVRIDLYNVDGKVYFGEYTFTPASGYQYFKPDSYDVNIGDMWDLTKI